MLLQVNLFLGKFDSKGPTYKWLSFNTIFNGGKGRGGIWKDEGFIVWITKRKGREVFGGKTWTNVV